MNNNTRKELKKVITTINNLRDIVSNLQEVEQYKFDNLPEGIQMSDTGMNLEDAAMALEDALGNFDEAIDNLETAMN